MNTLTQTNTIDAMLQLKIDRCSVSYCENFIFFGRMFNTNSDRNSRMCKIIKSHRPLEFLTRSSYLFRFFLTRDDE